MKTLSRFVAKFTNLIVAVLSCFDRVIFKGYLPITNGPALEGFVDHILKIRRLRLHASPRGQTQFQATLKLGLTPYRTPSSPCASPRRTPYPVTPYPPRVLAVPQADGGFTSPLAF